MRKLFFIALLFGISLFSSGYWTQHRAFVDSLIQTFVDAEDDSRKIDQLIEGLPHIIEIEPDTVIYFATKGALLASKFNRPKAKVRLVGMIGDACYSKADYSRALENLIN